VDDSFEVVADAYVGDCEDWIAKNVEIADWLSKKL